LSLCTKYKIFDVDEEAILDWNRSIQVVVAYANIENGKVVSELLRLAKNEKEVQRLHSDRWRQSNQTDGGGTITNGTSREKASLAHPFVTLGRIA
jgi:hypothetical protein